MEPCCDFLFFSNEVLFVLISYCNCLRCHFFLILLKLGLHVWNSCCVDLLSVSMLGFGFRDLDCLVFKFLLGLSHFYLHLGKLRFCFENQLLRLRYLLLLCFHLYVLLLQHTLELDHFHSLIFLDFAAFETRHIILTCLKLLIFLLLRLYLVL